MTKGQSFDIVVDHFGEKRTVRFVARYARDADEMILISEQDVAYCSVGGKCWPCPLEIYVMTSSGRARDEQFPARRSIPTICLRSHANRLNRNYPIAGFWSAGAERNRSQHHSA